MKATTTLCFLLAAFVLAVSSAKAQLIDPFTNRPVGPTGADSEFQGRIMQSERLAAERGYWQRTGMAQSKSLQPGEVHTIKQWVGGSKPIIFVLTCDAGCGSLNVAAKFVQSGQPVNVTLIDDGHFAFLETQIAELANVEISTSIQQCSRHTCAYYIAAYQKF